MATRNTPMHIAASVDSKLWEVPFLSEAGNLNVDLRNNNGDTPLMIAAQTPNLYVVDFMLRSEANVCLTNNGKTAFQMLQPWIESHSESIKRRHIYYSFLGTALKFLKAGDRQWALVPAPLPGLETLFYQVWLDAPDERVMLFQRLEEPKKELVRLVLRKLHRLLPVGKFEDLRMQILAVCIDSDHYWVP